MTRLLEVTNVRRHFPVGGGLFRAPATIRAVHDVSFEIAAGETLGLIGESGCGKTTIAKLVLGLDRTGNGSIRFEGKNIDGLSREDFRNYRLAVQAVFQDPQSSLNPRMRVREIVGEPLIAGTDMAKGDIFERVVEVLRQVGIDATMAGRFPHQFSGGQRQRIAIARALAANARLIVLDEPVASLDVSVRSQVLNLLRDLQERHGLSYLLISHDLATSAYLCHRMAVMYLGQIVEMGPTEQIYATPRHPYTQALLAAASLTPQPGMTFSGEVPSPIAPPPGCHFHPRCPKAMARCRTEPPSLAALAPDQTVACHLYDEKGPLHA